MYRATLSWSQPPKLAFHGFSPWQHFFVLLRNRVSSLSLEGLRRNLIIQEPKEWPGQIHELHRLQQTTIRGEEAALSKTTSPAKKQIFNLQQNRNPNKKDKKKKKINIQLPQKYFCQTP
jgi:hypothetical protein